MTPFPKSNQQLEQELERAQARIVALEKAAAAQSDAPQMVHGLLSAITDIAVCIMLPDGTIMMANPAFAMYLGHAGEDVTGRNIFFSFPSYLSEQYRQSIAECAADGEPVQFREERRGQHTVNSIHPTEGVDGQPAYYVLCVRDVTEKERRFDLLQRYRVQLEEMIRRRALDLNENQRVLTTLMNNLPGMAYRCLSDKQWTMLFVSQGALDLTGYPPSALIENKEVAYADIIHPEDRAQIREQVTQALSAKAPYQLEYRITTAKGAMKWVWEQGEGVWTPEGELVALEGFIADITEQREVERALQETERHYRELFERGNDAIFLLSLEGKLLAANQRVVDLIGYEPKELIGTSFKDAIAPEEQGLGKAKLKAILAGETPPIYERNFVHKSGRYVPVEINAALIHDRDGDPLYVQSIVRDISDRKRYIRRLEGLRDIDHAILVNRSSELIAQEALNYLHKLIPYHRAVVTLIDFEASEFWRIAGKHMMDDVDMSLHVRCPLEGNLLDAESLQGKTMYVMPELDKVENPTKLIQEITEQGVRSLLSMVLRAHDEVIGLFSIGMSESGDFSAEDIEIMQEIANQLAIAIFNARLLESEREQRVAAQALYDTAAALNSSLSIDGVMERILNNVERVVPHDGANIMLLDGDMAHVVRVHGYGFSPEAKEHIRHLRSRLTGQGFLSYMRREQRPLVIPDTKNSGLWVNTPALKWVRSYLGVPIVTQGEVRGFINLDSRTTYRFNQKDMERLQAFADQAAIALNNARLYEALHEYSRDLELAVAARTSELQHAQERAESILYNSPTATLMLKAGGLIDTANPACYELFGLKEAEVLDKPLTELFTPEDRDKVMDALAAAVQEEPSDPTELTGVYRRGGTFDAEMSLSLVEQGSELLGIVCNIRNISDFKSVERLKDEFVSTAAHELRTPLTSVRGFSEILLTRELDDARRSRYLMLINQQALELAHIIDELLDISRLEARQMMVLKEEQVNIPSLLADTLEPFSDVSPNHRFVIEAEDDLPRVQGDPFRLAQVTRNLLSNAVKYSPEGGDVIVRCGVQGKYLAVSVVDEGIGMTPEEQAHLFEKFYRARTVPSISGTGLGLTICRLIVESHGGRIAVESEYGVGTTVTFTLPLNGDHSS